MITPPAKGRLDPVLEQTNRLGESGDSTPPGPYPRLLEESPVVTEFERLEAGWGAHFLPASVTWIRLDGSRPMGDAGGSYVGWREDSSGDTSLVARAKPVDPLPWISKNVAPEKKRLIMSLLSLWYPGRNGRPCGFVPSPIWIVFLRLFGTRNLQDENDYARLLMDAICYDIDNLRERQRDCCGQRTMVGLYRERSGVGWSSPRTELRRWRCKSWTCLYCSTKMQYKSGHRLSQALVAFGQENALDRPLLVTLTMNPEEIRRLYPMLSEAQREVLSWKLVKSQWKKFVRQARKRWGDPSTGEKGVLHYFHRIEGHRSGYAHLHAAIICRSWYSAARNDLRSGKPRSEWPSKIWMESAAQKAGYGRICDVQVIRDRKKVAYYLSKASSLSSAGRNLCAVAGEVTKAKQVRSQRIPRGFRTIEASRGFWEEAELQGMCLPEPEGRIERIYSSVGMVGLSLDEIAEIRNISSDDLHRVLDWSQPYVEGDPPMIAEQVIEVDLVYTLGEKHFGVPPPVPK